MGAFVWRNIAKIHYVKAKRLGKWAYPLKSPVTKPEHFVPSAKNLTHGVYNTAELSLFWNSQKTKKVDTAGIVSIQAK